MKPTPCPSLQAGVLHLRFSDDLQVAIRREVQRGKAPEPVLSEAGGRAEGPGVSGGVPLNNSKINSPGAGGRDVIRPAISQV